MEFTKSRSHKPTGFDRGVVALGCAVVLAMNPMVIMAAEASKPTPAPAAGSGTPASGTAAPAATAPPAAAPGASGASGASGAAAAPEVVKLSNDQIDSLVAPIALYPDDLLAQTLVASTYPLEIIQLYQWLDKHKDLKDKALADAVGKEGWDPSVSTMAAVPDVVKRLADDIQWTTDLGNAFLAQQKDVMDSCQRMRKKAKDKGALTSNEQQKVETKVIEQKEVIVVQSSNPEVVHVPSYDPVYVYGPPAYPYPPIYYPYYAPGAAFVSFSFGVAMGAAFWGGSCCGCGWGGGDVDINVDNNFNRNTNINNSGNRGDGNRGDGNRGSGNRGGASNKGGGGKWQHNPSHRGAAPYGDKGTANKYGGQARGDSPRASQQPSRGGSGGRGGSPSAGNMAAGGGGRGGSPSAGTRDAGGGSRGGGSSASSRGGGSSKGGGFSGGSGSRGYSGSSARSAGSRGSSSFGGGRGGGGRGGGGRR